VRQHEVSFDDPWIGEFARYFGRPAFRIDYDDQWIIEVTRLVGVPGPLPTNWSGWMCRKRSFRPACFTSTTRAWPQRIWTLTWGRR
jgi:hypothetical protein